MDRCIYFAISGLLTAFALLLISFIIMNFNLVHDRNLMWDQAKWVLPAGFIGGFSYGLITNCFLKKGEFENLLIKGIAILIYFLIIIYSYVRSFVEF